MGVIQKHGRRLVMKLVDRDNLVAVVWGVVYTLSLVVIVGTFHELGILPTITVPVVMVVLPLALGGVMFVMERVLVRRGNA